MESISGTVQGSQAVDLALATSESVLQISNLLIGREVNGEHKKFHRHLMIHCILVSDHVNRIRSAAGPENEFIVRILALFESLIAPKVTRSYTTQMHPRQRALNQHWKSLQNQSNDVKLKFARQCLSVGQSTEPRFRQEFDKSFEMWEKDVIAKYPEDGSQWSIDDRPPPKNSRAEPSYAVWSAAQSLFKALSGSIKCECHPTYELGARLCLGTYRKPDPDDTNDFDMFLSLQQDCQEAHVRTIRDGVVRFAVNDESQAQQKKKKLYYKPMVVKKLCEQIQKPNMTSQRLEFKVEKGRLFKLRSERSSFGIDKKKAPVSLQQFINKGSRSLTEKTKRILAVLLSYAILHLHGTPWLQSAWDSSNILFFQTSSSKIPLRPFFQTRLSSQNVCPDPSQTGQQEGLDSHPDDSDSDGVGPDDVDPDDVEHPFPTLVALAVMLMELYFATPFGSLARDCGVELLVGTDSHKRSLDVASVFNECKCEIPRNSQFYYAIEKCLDPWTWEDENGQKLDDQMLRVTVYQEVVRPLEDELCNAFDFITIEELDKIAEKVDFGSWGQTIQNQQADAHFKEAGSPMEGALLHRDQYVARSQVQFQHTVVVTWNQDAPSLSRLEPGLSQPLTPEYKAAKFFDDEKASEDHSPAELQNYLSWKAKYKDVYEKFIEPHLQDPPQSPVKIAVLDSGVDETHNALDTGQIKRKLNWTNNFKKEVHDHYGHGTFTASLLVDYAPDAELYIAKIADEKLCPPGIIAEAIRFAVDDWKVDIISMSFGYPTNQIDGYGELEEALLYAHSNNVLLFAAASNSGANQDRAYPARDPHIICVHSTDSKGNRSKFSPTALTRDPNIATIGEAVQSAWPVNLCDMRVNPDGVQCKSGTSYATPITVGIAAFLLQYARLHLADKADMLKRQSKMKDLLLKIAEKTQQSISRDDYNYVALSLFQDNLFGKDKHFIDVTIGDLLKR